MGRSECPQMGFLRRVRLVMRAKDGDGQKPSEGLYPRSDPSECDLLVMPHPSHGATHCSSGWPKIFSKLGDYSMYRGPVGGTIGHRIGK
jgi:hypothetical protein